MLHFAHFAKCSAQYHGANLLYITIMVCFSTTIIGTGIMFSPRFLSLPTECFCEMWQLTMYKIHQWFALLTKDMHILIISHSAFLKPSWTFCPCFLRWGVVALWREWGKLGCSHWSVKGWEVISLKDTTFFGDNLPKLFHRSEEFTTGSPGIKGLVISVRHEKYNCTEGCESVKLWIVRILYLHCGCPVIA